MNPPVSTQSILFAVARRMGLVPNQNLSPDQGAEILQFMDDRLREAWESYDFIENTTTEERAFRPDYDPEACYNQGDVVWDPCSRAYYTAVNTGVGGPLSNTSLWTSQSSVAPSYVEWWQGGKTPIGTAFECYTSNPYEDLKAKKVQFVVSSRGLEFIPYAAITTVWVYFRYPYPSIGQAFWDSSLVYNLGDATLAEDGHTYLSSVDGNTGQDPLSSPSAWNKFPIPYIFSRFVIMAAFSDTLVTNGQNEKAQLLTQGAYAYLNSEFDKQRLQQGQEERFSVNIS